MVKDWEKFNEAKKVLGENVVNIPDFDGTLDEYIEFVCGQLGYLSRKELDYFSAKFDENYCLGRI